MRQHDVVTCPIVGGTKTRHLENAVSSLTVELDDVDRSRLEKDYGTAPAKRLLTRQY